MPEFPSPFEEPVREESVGEARERLAAFLQGPLKLTDKETEAVSSLIGYVFRRWPVTREWEKMLYKAVANVL